MTLTASERRAVERRDREARRDREIESLVQAAMIAYPSLSDESYPEGTLVVQTDARAMGATTALTHRASQSSWTVPGRPRQLRGRVRGVAPGTAQLDTVLCRYADGTSEIRSVRSFREQGAATTVAAAPARRDPETARIGVTHDLTGD